MVTGRELAVNGQSRKRKVREAVEGLPEVILCKLEGENPSYKFVLTKSGYNLMNSTRTTEDRAKVFIASNLYEPLEWFITSNEEFTTGTKSVVLNKNKTFSNKNAYVNIVKAFKLDTNIDNKFSLLQDSIDKRLLQMMKISEEDNNQIEIEEYGNISE